MSQQQPEQSLGALFADASRDLSKLVHDEIELAKAEIRREVKNGATGGAMFGAAAFVAVLAVILVSIAAAYGLVALGLHPGLRWADVFGVAVLTGIGFAVPLLVSDVAFGAGSEQDDRVTAGILAAALLSACLGAVLLRLRHRHYERLYDEENRDEDEDGVPDVYQANQPGQTDLRP